MLDDTISEAICVIDLDTVILGSALYDFGDMVRTTTCPVEEGERNLSGITNACLGQSFVRIWLRPNYSDAVFELLGGCRKCNVCIQKALRHDLQKGSI
jgi:hypothetical protein